jgi:polyisoprenoid-binding protein YceI
MKQLVIDPAHSDLGFKIRHLMVSNVKGTLTNYSGGMSYTTEDMSDAQIRFEAEVNSISTGNSDRDAHLNGEDFFNTERFPKMYFESTYLNLTDGKMRGEMTIKDTTKTIDLTVEYNGKSTDPWGNTKHGFEITGVINRSDFDLTWNATLETGGVLLSDEVKLNLDVQMMELVGEMEPQIEEQAV